MKTWSYIVSLVILITVGACLDTEDNVTIDSYASTSKITLCHVPPGNPGNAHEITVGEPAVRAHLAHGDFIGPCEPEEPCQTSIYTDDSESTLATNFAAGEKRWVTTDGGADTFTFTNESGESITTTGSTGFYVCVDSCGFSFAPVFAGISLFLFPEGDTANRLAVEAGFFEDDGELVTVQGGDCEPTVENVYDPRR